MLMASHYVVAIRNDVYTRDSLLVWFALITDAELPVEPPNNPSSLARGFLNTIGVNTRPRSLSEPCRSAVQDKICRWVADLRRDGVEMNGPLAPVAAWVTEQEAAHQQHQRQVLEQVLDCVIQ